MYGILIIISSFSMFMLLYKIISPGMTRSILPVIVSILYAVLMFYIGFSISVYLLYIMSLIPIIGILFIEIRQRQNN